MLICANARTVASLYSGVVNIKLDKIKALPPLLVKVNWKILLKAAFFFLLSLLLWAVLIVCAVNILVYYVISIKENGFLHKETLKFAVYLVIGTYFFLILDKKKVYDAFGIKKGLPYITPEQADLSKCKIKKND